MSDTLWTKNGKLVVDSSGNMIACDSCPCTPSGCDKENAIIFEFDLWLKAEYFKVLNSGVPSNTKHEAILVMDCVLPRNTTFKQPTGPYPTTLNSCGGKNRWYCNYVTWSYPNILIGHNGDNYYSITFSAPVCTELFTYCSTFYVRIEDPDLHLYGSDVSCMEYSYYSWGEGWTDWQEGQCAYADCCINSYDGYYYRIGKSYNTKVYWKKTGWTSGDDPSPIFTVSGNLPYFLTGGSETTILFGPSDGEYPYYLTYLDGDVYLQDTMVIVVRGGFLLPQFEANRFDTTITVHAYAHADATQFPEVTFPNNSVVENFGICKYEWHDSWEWVYNGVTETWEWQCFSRLIENYEDPKIYESKTVVNTEIKNFGKLTTASDISLSTYSCFDERWSGYNICKDGCYVTLAAPVSLYFPDSEFGVFSDIRLGNLKSSADYCPYYYDTYVYPAANRIQVHDWAIVGHAQVQTGYDSEGGVYHTVVWIDIANEWGWKKKTNEQGGTYLVISNEPDPATPTGESYWVQGYKIDEETGAWLCRPVEVPSGQRYEQCCIIGSGSLMERLDPQEETVYVKKERILLCSLYPTTQEEQTTNDGFSYYITKPKTYDTTPPLPIYPEES